MSTKLSKEDLKSPDQVTQTLRKGFVWTTSHSKMVITAIAVFIVVGIAWSFVNYSNEKKEVAQQEKYFSVEKAYTEKKRGFDEAARAEVAAVSQKNKKPTPAADPAKKATGDIQKDYGTIITGFEGMIADAPKTKAGQMAALNLSDIYVTYKKHDEALAALSKVETGLNKSDAISALIYMQMGNVFADKGDCKAAVEKWQTIVSSKSFAFAHDEAKIRQGVCYESMNDAAKAEQLYMDVAKKEDPNTSDFAAAREANKYLRLLKAKKNL
ncbi:MAG: tetratricopeptide repeat protein [Bdellovibrio sp.]